MTAFETRPEHDYIAGDATNAWPADVVDEAVRQLVFLKPDTVIVYDRVRLHEPATTRWLATTAPGLEMTEEGFRAGDQAAAVQATILLPEGAQAMLPKQPANFNWKGQQLVGITSPVGQASSPVNVVEYLVVLRVGDDKVQPADAELIERDGMVGVAIDGSDWLFNRSGDVGGPGLSDRVDNSYRHWESDPRYAKWMTESRFDFIMGEHGRAAE
ncbi:MAG TPA: hypothetical protein QGH10_19420 [Armatimonadota bacterium]|nr:hypothetical protein [Armatimonadota bacterium]